MVLTKGKIKPTNQRPVILDHDIQGQSSHIPTENVTNILNKNKNGLFYLQHSVHLTHDTFSFPESFESNSNSSLCNEFTEKL